nr:hypothetical protein [Tanacetum cinerariifolium]
MQQRKVFNSGKLFSNVEIGRKDKDSNVVTDMAANDRESLKKTVTFSKLYNDEVVDGAALAILIKAVKEASSRFFNTLYGYFIGKRLAFPVVENYVKSTREKFGLECVMLQNGFFFFQFATHEGVEWVIESGSWLIILVPLILNVWTPNSKLRKNAITSAPLCVMLHNELNDSLVVAIPFSNGTGHTLEIIEVQYQWEFPRCTTCNIFYHNDEQCPKKVKEVVSDPIKDNDFTQVSCKRGKAKSNPKNKQVEGIKLTKPKLNLSYRPIAKSIPKESLKAAQTATNDSDSEEVEELVLEEPIVCEGGTKDNMQGEWPIGLRSCDTWDLDRVTWGVRAKGVGTVQVRWDGQECSMGKVEVLEGNVVGVVRVSGFGRFGPWVLYNLTFGFSVKRF